MLLDVGRREGSDRLEHDNAHVWSLERAILFIYICFSKRPMEKNMCRWKICHLHRNEQAEDGHPDKQFGSCASSCGTSLFCLEYECPPTEISLKGWTVHGIE